MSPALDDSLGEDVAMLMVMMIAAVAAATPTAEAPQNGSAACDVAIEKVEFVLDVAPAIPSVPSFGWSIEAKQQVLIVSKIVGGAEKPSPDESGKLPENGKSDRDPAVLLPKCQHEARPKRKRRLSDYPMA
jgi:hypothetical protein